MPELAEVQTKKTAGFVDRGYNYEKRQQRMKAEEEEIKRLEAEARGKTPVDEEPKQEVTQEEDELKGIKGELKNASKSTINKQNRRKI